ncbi:MAG: hypothetical protein AABZ08_13555 [Planctomycetota bacterium]
MMSEGNRENLNEIERDERWLAGVKTLAPTAESVARAKRAIRAELSATIRPTGIRWRSSSGLIAAAACIAFAVYVGWNAIQTTPSNVTTPQIAQNTAPKMNDQPTQPKNIEDNVAVTESDSDSSVAMTTQIDENLSTLEEWSKESTWDLTGSSLSAALDEIYSEPTTTGQKAEPS